MILSPMNSTWPYVSVSPQLGHLGELYCDGAHGVHSVVRRQLFPDQCRARFTGFVLWARRVADPWKAGRFECS